MKIPRPKPPIDVEEAKRLYVDEGLSLAEVGDQLRVQTRSVRRALLRSGVKLRPRQSSVRNEADRQLHSVWSSIVGRCTRPRDRLYARYGARGVRLCDAWREFSAFRDWALAHGWKPGLALGLTDRWKGYAPENCTWISRSENIQRGILDGPRGSRWAITAFGETKTAQAWSSDPRCTVSGECLLNRIAHGMNPEQAVTLPAYSEQALLPGPPRPRGRKRWHPIDWDKVRDLYVQKRLEVSEVATLLGASYHGVLAGLRSRGLLRATKSVPLTKIPHGRRLHKAWQNMHERCRSEAHPEYEKVGGRGIRVCAEWREFIAFHAWALRSGYRPGLCLARTDRGKNYEPSNCTWLTRQEMSARIEPTISRKPRWTVTALGETKSPAAWSRDRRCTVSLSGLLHRLRHQGLSGRDAITAPAQTPGRPEPEVLVKAFGVEKGLVDWARDRRCRVGEASLRQRIRKGVPAEVAITTPPFRVHAKARSTSERRGR